MDEKILTALGAFARQNRDLIQSGAAGRQLHARRDSFQTALDAFGQVLEPLLGAIDEFPPLQQHGLLDGLGEGGFG